MTQPNILFVIFDDLGISDVTQTLMPNVWNFGTKGGARTFTRTYSMPICSQSRSCMLYGKYGRTLGIIEGQSPFNGPEPDATLDTLPSLLHDSAGYSTALIGKWHLGRNPLDTLSQFLGAPAARGFDHWLAGTPENLDDFFSWPRVDDDAETTETVYATLAQVNAATAWWQSTQGPKYLQVAFNSPHGPYHFPPEDELDGFQSSAQSENRRQYESEIRSVDWAFGQLLGILEPGTVVAMVGDNGTPNNARNAIQQMDRVKSTCYEGGVRVPLAIRSKYPAGTTDRLVHICDIPATLLALAGIEVPQDWDGHSLIGLPRENCLSEAELGDAGEHDHWRAAITKRYKLLRRNDDPEELYDLQVDPNELSPLNLMDPANSTILSYLRDILYG